MLIKAHITMNARAEEALRFYKEVFNGSIEDLLRFGDVWNNPMISSLGESYKNKIMNARLTVGNNILGFCDSMPDEPVNSGNMIALDMSSYDEKEIHHVFNALSEGGKVVMPLTTTFFSPNYAVLIDKFGILWNIMQMPSK